VAGMVRQARKEGKAWEKVSRPTKEERTMIYVLKFMKKGHTKFI
jgi:hypothetical protein